MAKKKQELGPLQQEWVRCLRSGEFPQGKFRLVDMKDPVRGVYRHCCLGVACCVAEAKGVGVEWEERSGALHANGQCAVLPTNVAKSMKFYDYDGQFQGFTMMDHEALTSANDLGATFKQIARFVEAHPEAVFTGPA
jgi:hypothetical protein